MAALPGLVRMGSGSLTQGRFTDSAESPKILVEVEPEQSGDRPAPLFYAANLRRIPRLC